MAYYEEDRYIPPKKLNENRSFWKYLILRIITFGIYDLFFFISFSFDLDKVASRHDGKKTINYIFAVLLGMVTVSIVILVWFYGVTERVSDELKRREIDYSFETSDFWMWNLLGTLIVVGPWVYVYKLIKAMNLICKSYNEEISAAQN